MGEGNLIVSIFPFDSTYNGIIVRRVFFSELPSQIHIKSNGSQDRQNTDPLGFDNLFMFYMKNVGHSLQNYFHP